MEDIRSEYNTGIIIGRFQVHDLHQAHRNLIDQVVKKHAKVILFLGVSPLIGTQENPLDFSTRKKMIQKYYPNIDILPLPDRRSDQDWSRDLDRRIREVHRIESVLLYGGRDSFIPRYHGSFQAEELEQTIYVSGTEIRKKISEEIKESPEWRAGCIYNSYNRYPTSYQTVDIACMNDDYTRLLLCKKPYETKYRFIGGFADPSDFSLEHSAEREFKEETGGQAEISKIRYISSFRVDDWRYRGSRDKIMTALFLCNYVTGPLSPSDDIEELKWFDVSFFKNGTNIEKTIVEEHHPLMGSLITNLYDKK